MAPAISIYSGGRFRINYYCCSSNPGELKTNKRVTTQTDSLGSFKNRLPPSTIRVCEGSGTGVCVCVASGPSFSIRGSRKEEFEQVMEAVAPDPPVRPVSLQWQPRKQRRQPRAQCDLWGHQGQSACSPAAAPSCNLVPGGPPPGGRARLVCCSQGQKAPLGLHLLKSALQGSLLYSGYNLNSLPLLGCKATSCEPRMVREPGQPPLPGVTLTPAVRTCRLGP